jgi:DNA polymerase-3 subunit delta'
VDLVGKPPDKAFLPLELLIGDAEHRMRAGLCYNITLKPYSGRRKLAIIDDADYLNKEGANCLLKTLEEPPPQSLLILIGTSEQRQLPTIRSRCQIVRFSPLSEEHVTRLLLTHDLCADRPLAEQAARLSGGSLQRAALWCDESILGFRRELFEMLLQTTEPLAAAAKRIGQFIDEAGKESAAKRQRLRLVVSLGEEFYRACLLIEQGGEAPIDESLQRLADSALKRMPVEAAAACLDICIDAYGHIESNVNQATFIDWWLDELSEATRLGYAHAS